MPIIHVIAPFYNVPAQRFSTCAYATGTRLFPKIAAACGYHTIEYSNEGSESEADQHVTLLREEERAASFPSGIPLVGSPGWQAFEARLKGAMGHLVRKGDIVAHMFGAASASIVRMRPDIVHVEPQVWYGDKPFGAYRVYGSEAWRHKHWGMALAAGIDFKEKNDRSLSWTIPISYDLAEWPLPSYSTLRSGQRAHALFMGQLNEGKGLGTIARIVKSGHPIDIEITSKGALPEGWLAQFTPAERERLIFTGPVYGLDRAAHMARARCILMPTTQVEPFGSVGVEAMLMGTPLIASNWGAFTETVEPWVSGFRCNTLKDWQNAIDQSAHLPRSQVSDYARGKYSIQSVIPAYQAMFERLSSLA